MAATGAREDLFREVRVTHGLERWHEREDAEKKARQLAADLKLKVHGEVRFDAGSRALWATAAGNYRQVPIGVVLPRSIDDIFETIAVCRRYGAPVLPRGGGTSLAGQCANVAVILDCSKYLTRLIELNPDQKYARVEPGIILDDLRDAAEKYNLTFAPDPSTHNHCTLGGMIGNNSCGVHSVYGGLTVDNVEWLDVVLYDGTQLQIGETSDALYEAIVRAGGRKAELYAAMRALRDRYADRIRAGYPKLKRRVSGYNLDQLLPEKGFHIARAIVGTEGTCTFVTEAKLRLVESPPFRTVIAIGYDDIYAAGDDVPRILEHQPLALEGMDDVLVNDMKEKGLHAQYASLLPEGGGFLIAEFGGWTKDEADDKANRLADALKKRDKSPSTKIYENKDEEAHLWKVRESGLGATARIPGKPETWEGWEDSAVPRDRIGDYLRVFRKKLEEYQYKGCSLYGHFGDGCIHTRIPFELDTREGIAKYRRFVEEMADIVVGFGGSLSGEHGDGQSRAEMLPKMFGEELVQAMREFKRIWDPTNKMNPGKVVDPYPLDSNLRLGADYHPIEVQTHFAFPDDKHDFAFASTRCVGVGECRREGKGTMCPSYMVTREEMHSTRGRARLLFEMLHGDPIEGVWQNEHVKEALDLCLACKGCKGDCPVNVDMATYKAEFLSHYYEGHVRPRHAWAFGLIDLWAQFARWVPGLANFVTQTKGLSAIAKWAANVAPEREIPAFARQTFRSWFAKNAGRDGALLVRPNRRRSRERVILWADTFNDNFHPEVARAATEVLEACGFEVAIAAERLCCGRPLYDFGMLDRAKTYLHAILDSLREEIRDGTKIVGLEPSCVSVLKDEMHSMFPDDSDVKRLREQTLMFGELLAQDLDAIPKSAKLHAKAVVHGHCHHKSILKFAGDEKVLHHLGVDAHVLDSGCCGMAGSFGFEADKYEVSMAVGERVLIPAVRDAASQSLIVTNGFSCREQIEQTTDRRPLHLAQVLKLALEGRVPAERPERAFPAEPASRAPWVVAMGLVGGIALGAMLGRLGRD